MTSSTYDLLSQTAISPLPNRPGKMSGAATMLQKRGDMAGYERGALSHTGAEEQSNYTATKALSRDMYQLW